MKQNTFGGRASLPARLKSEITTHRIIAGVIVLLLFVCNGGHGGTTSGAATGLKPLNVGFLVLDHVYNSELMAPYDIFHHTKFHTKPAMRVFTISLDGKSVETFEGLTIQRNCEDAHGRFRWMVSPLKPSKDCDCRRTTAFKMRQRSMCS